MNEYELLFQYNALKDFHLDPTTYLCLTEGLTGLVTEYDIIDHQNNLFQTYIENEQYKQGIKQLEKLLQHYMDIVSSPDQLTNLDLLGLCQMKKYLTDNSGHSHGYFKYRKQYYQQQCDTYTQLSLQNKIIVFVHQDTIVNDLCQKINTLQKLLKDNLTLHKFTTAHKYKQTKLRWAKTYVQCSDCQKYYLQANRHNHIKTKHHQNATNL